MMKRSLVWDVEQSKGSRGDETPAAAHEGDKCEGKNLTRIPDI